MHAFGREWRSGQARVAGAILAVCVQFNCGGSTGGPGDAGNVNTPDAGDAGNVTTADAGDAGSTTAADGTGIVTAGAGGTVSLDGGASVQVPAGAVAADTTLTIARSDDAAPAGALSPLFVFGPDGTSFAKPVTVTIPVNAGATSGSIYWTKAGSTTAYETVATSFAAGAASGQVTHFSRGFVGAACTGTAACDPGIVCSAGALNCASGAPVCVDTGNAPDGTVCGQDLVCSNGDCLSATRTVTGSFRATFQHDDGTTQEALDQLLLPPDSIVYPDGAGGFTTVSLTLDADGNFSVPSVPRGTYYLKTSFETVVNSLTQDLTTFVELLPLTADNPDLTAFFHGRASATRALRATNVTLNASGLDPWSNAGPTPDSLFLTTGQALTTEEAARTQRPADGATEAALTFEWVDSFVGAENNLPDAAQGDSTWVYQRHSAALSNGGQAALVDRFARSDSFTLQDGVAASLTVALQAAPLSQSAPTSTALSEFAALVPEMNPAASLSPDPDSLSAPFAETVIFSQAGSLSFPDEGSTSVAARVREVQVPYSRLDTDADFGTVQYGGFLDSNFHEYREFFYATNLVLSADGNKVGVGPVFLIQTPADSLPAVLEPTLSPIRLPLIQGKDAFTAQTGVGLTPTLSWTAPALGQPSSYAVEIIMVSPPDDENSIGFVQTRVYGGTSFTVPPGLLQAGKTYAADITAIQTVEDQNRPFRTGLPFAQTDAVTNTFTP
jgi:hypothetical protein